MLKRVLSAGDMVDSQCTRCRALTNHTIVAMVAGQVVRVKCNTCGSEHNHRPVKEAKEAKPATTRSQPTERAARPTTASGRTRSVKAPAISEEDLWQEAIRPYDPDLAVPYRMDANFKVNTLVQHPTFGIGLVALSQSGKIEVIFKSGRKLLRCAA